MDDTSGATSDLGQKLRRLRKSKRMTQKQVADRLYLRPSTVSSYERNDKTPSLFTLKKLAYLFNVSADFLLGMESRYQINTDGLTSRQIFLIEETIESFRRKNPR
ncbi:helix-turn-helix transcriptional regulator [Clostridium sp. D33t1_170424_F3]|uniref:helix-turn-helix domain-containing protein n=1 Tax=Clostridium sp. D33t1_170424_F3 TaxID=2787099 RepID=UPI0018AA4885|nr:helix-turn-helix transcriptional regulator [Clostridium sp. D33t1_170424_F3]